MAATITCDLCGAEPAALMQSNMANGETIAVGDACLIPFMATVLTETLTSMDAATAREWMPAVKPLLAAVDALAEPPAPAPAVRGKRKPAATAQPETTPDGGNGEQAPQDTPAGQ